MIEERDVMIRVRRVFRRCLQSKGFRHAGKGAARLYTEEHLQWARVLDWAKSGICQPIDFAAPLICQPFYYRLPTHSAKPPSGVRPEAKAPPHAGLEGATRPLSPTCSYAFQLCFAFVWILVT